MDGNNRKVFCEKLDQTWAFISHKLGSEVVPAPVNVINGMLHESHEVRACQVLQEWAPCHNCNYSCGLHGASECGKM